MAGLPLESVADFHRNTHPGREDLHLHSLRHSCAIYWLRQGMSIVAVRDLLGHASVQTTERYLRAMGGQALREWQDPG